MHDVLGVEFDVEPGAAIRDDAGGEQQLAGRMRLALIVIEEHAGRTVHLRDDHALGAVDHEGAVHRHERDIAHVDVLLLDVLDGTRAGLFVNIEHDQPQRHLQRRGIGHAALAAFVDVIFRRLEFVADEFQHGGIRKVGDRKYRPEHGLQSFIGTAAGGLLHKQELVVGRLLNLNEVRHLCDFLNFSEELPNSLATGKSLRHRGLSLRHAVSAGTAGTRGPFDGGAASDVRVKRNFGKSELRGACYAITRVARPSAKSTSAMRRITHQNVAIPGR